MREMILTDKVRIDGRDTKTVRPITVEASCCPVRTARRFSPAERRRSFGRDPRNEHDAQSLDPLFGDTYASSSCTTTSRRTPSVKPAAWAAARREMGHGALAERSVKAILPESTRVPT